MSATLGGLLKDFRIKKGIQQIDIAFSLGWKETSRLSRIEQGKSAKPPRDLIENIAKAMQLTAIEKNQLLLAGNYLPTEQEIAYIKEKSKDFIDKWPYPANLLDFSWRSILENERMFNVHNVPPNLAKFIIENHSHVLDILFNPDLPSNKNMDYENKNLWKQFLKYLILQFRYEQSNRTQEKWYIDHIKNMMKNDLFKSLWIESQSMTMQDALVGKFAINNIPHPEDPNKLLNFYLFVVPVLEDPRFEITMLVPSDVETYRFYPKNDNK